MSASINKRNKYSPEFKDQVLARAEKEGVIQVAKDLGKHLNRQANAATQPLYQAY